MDHAHASVDRPPKTSSGGSGGDPVALATPTSFAQVSAVSKRQTAVCHSRPEAEIVAADHAVRVDSTLMRNFVEPILGISKVTLYEDNETCLHVIKTEKTAILRHLGRTHRVDISFLHEQWEEETFNLVNYHTTQQRADVLTKFFPEAKREEWDAQCEPIGHV